MSGGGGCRQVQWHCGTSADLPGGDERPVPECRLAASTPRRVGLQLGQELNGSGSRQVVATETVERGLNGGLA